MHKAQKTAHRPNPAAGQSRLSRVVSPRLLNIALVTTLVLVGAYVLTIGARVTRGVSVTAETPTRSIRLQIVNASGFDGVGRALAARFRELSETGLDVVVVDIKEFDQRQLSHSLVIARGRDTAGARMLSRKLGLDPSDVVYQPLDYDTDLISVTLVVGEDYENLRFPQETDKETQ
jgi:hypothetical protein